MNIVSHDNIRNIMLSFFIISVLTGCIDSTTPDSTTSGDTTLNNVTIKSLMQAGNYFSVSLDPAETYGDISQYQLIDNKIDLIKSYEYSDTNNQWIVRENSYSDRDISYYLSDSGWKERWFSYDSEGNLIEGNVRKYFISDRYDLNEKSIYQTLTQQEFISGGVYRNNNSLNGDPFAGSVFSSSAIAVKTNSIALEDFFVFYPDYNNACQNFNGGQNCKFSSLDEVTSSNNVTFHSLYLRDVDTGDERINVTYSDIDLTKTSGVIQGAMYNSENVNLIWSVRQTPNSGRLLLFTVGDSKECGGLIEFNHNVYSLDFCELKGKVSQKGFITFNKEAAMEIMSAYDPRLLRSAP